MQIMVAYCGLQCKTCPIHLATLERHPSKQQTMRVEIARVCREQYGMEVALRDITDCDGCRSRSGRLFSGCARCDIRKCAIERQLTSCAFCSDYACERLLKHFETDPGARGRLEAMRSTL
jgi:hypothetical protein